MAKAIFTTKAAPSYDDLPEQRYHFPRTYLRQVEQTVADLVVYYEPRRSSSDLSSRGGRQSYFAVARVERIEADTALADHYYAFVTDYLEFDVAVPFRDGGRFYETGLRRADGETNKGAFGRAVRLLTNDDFEAILSAGFRPAHSIEDSASGFAEAVPEYLDRPIVEIVVARPFRERAFARQVQAAYDSRCAFTRLRIINGGGRAEAQAAHIQPVAQRGPDSVRNALALCGTAHWMFDRGLLSVSDDLSILAANSGLPEDALRLLNTDRRLHLPRNEALFPHRNFLRYHRERVFKG